MKLKLHIYAVVFRMRVLRGLFSLQKLFSLGIDINFQAYDAGVDALNPLLSLVVVAALRIGKALDILSVMESLDALGIDEPGVLQSLPQNRRDNEYMMLVDFAVTGRYSRMP